MPTYTYRCRDCHTQFDLTRSMFDESQVVCPECDSDQTAKVPTCPAIVFDWKNFDFDDGAIAHAGPNRFRPSAAPASLK